MTRTLPTPTPSSDSQLLPYLAVGAPLCVAHTCNPRWAGLGRASGCPPTPRMPCCRAASLPLSDCSPPAPQASLGLAEPPLFLLLPSQDPLSAQVFLEFSQPRGCKEKGEAMAGVRPLPPSGSGSLAAHLWASVRLEGPRGSAMPQFPQVPCLLFAWWLLCLCVSWSVVWGLVSFACSQRSVCGPPSPHLQPRVPRGWSRAWPGLVASLPPST